MKTLVFHSVCNTQYGGGGYAINEIHNNHRPTFEFDERTAFALL